MEILKLGSIDNICGMLWISTENCCITSTEYIFCGNWQVVTDV